MQNKRGKLVLFGITIGKAVMLLAAGAVLGTLLLALSYLLPVNQDNRELSDAVIEQEGWYPRTSVGAPGQFFESFYPDVLDNFTDKIMLSTAMDTSAGNPLVRAMETYSEYVGSYNHYWHGYVAILRPLFLFMDFSDLRNLNAACQLLLVALLVLLVGRKKGFRYGLSLLTSYLLLSPRTTALGLQYTWVFYVAFGGTFALLSKREFFVHKNRYLYFFIVLGMLTCYLDLLTFPLLAWGFPLVWWIVTDGRERKSFQWIKDVVLSGIAWIFGYGGLWVAKWGIATMVLGRNIFETAFKEIVFCSGTTGTRVDNSAARWHAIYTNWRHYSYKIYAFILALWLIWWLSCSLRKKWEQSSKSPAFFLIGFSSIVWYVVLSNHTLIHHFFTHRIYGVSIAAFLAIVLESTGDFREAERLSPRERVRKFGLLGVSTVLAGCCMLGAKEEMMITNGTADFQRMQMERGLETEFIPPTNTIAGISFGLECESLQGRYEIKLWEGDKLKYENTFFLENRELSNYQSLTTWWMLKRGRTYRLTIEVIGTDAPVTAWMTQKGDMILPELGEVSVDGVKTGGQFLMGFRYMDRHYVPFERQVFLVLTWIGIFMAAGYTLWGIKRTAKAREKAQKG